MHDILIVGGGPAGLTAALYALRNGRTCLVIEKDSFGGQITHSPRVENYPGIRTMTGNEFAEKLTDQVLSLGADIEVDKVTGIRREGEGYAADTESGVSFTARSVILANGVRHRSLGLEGEEDLVGEGVSYCAVCDGDFYTGRKVCVAGGGNSALQEALLLADKCEKVTVLQDLDHLTGEEPLRKALLAKTNVEVLTGVKIVRLDTTGGQFTGVTVEKNGRAQGIPCDGLFVAIGLIPDNGAFADVAGLDGRGYYSSGEDCRTRTEGVFTAGDCRAKEIRQLTTAAADGACAALAACRYLNGMI